MNKSPKKYTVAVCLSAIFGVIGVHHFYLERWAHGSIDLTLSLIALYFFSQQQYIWAGLFFLMDLVHTVYVTSLLIIGKYKDGNGLFVKAPNH